MSSGQRACIDDEEDWENEKLLFGISEVKYNCYSSEAKWARAGYAEHKFTGALLLAYIKIEKEFNEAKSTYSRKLNILKEVMTI